MMNFKINMSQIAFKHMIDFIEQKDQSYTFKIHITLLCTIKLKTTKMCIKHLKK